MKYPRTKGVNNVAILIAPGSFQYLFMNKFASEDAGLATAIALLAYDNSGNCFFCSVFASTLWRKATLVVALVSRFVTSANFKAWERALFSYCCRRLESVSPSLV